MSALDLDRLETLAAAAATAGPCAACTSVSMHMCGGSHGAGCQCDCHRNTYIALKVFQIAVEFDASALVAEVRRLRAKQASTDRRMAALDALFDVALPRCDECASPATVASAGARNFVCDRHRVGDQGSELSYAPLLRDLGGQHA